MAKYKPQHRRLLFIDRKLRDGRYPNCGTLASEWEVSVKTIQRDIEYMRDELDAPVDYDAVRHGYHYTEPSFSLPAINVGESDLFAVCIAQTVLSQFRNTPLFNKLSSVFQKIQDSLPDKTAIHPSWLGERILVFHEPATRVNPQTWDVLAKAIRDNRRVSICHKSPARKGAAVGRRTVDPYYLVSFKGEWYLNGYCHHRKAIRTFAVSRITRAIVLNEPFQMSADMTRDRMFGDQMGIIWKDKFYKVRIRFSAEVAPYIRERQWHPAQRTKDLRNGGLVLEFTTNHLNEVKDWILSWGANATVLGPPDLARRVTAGLKDALGNYR